MSPSVFHRRLRCVTALNLTPCQNRLCLQKARWLRAGASVAALFAEVPLAK
jgi:hypothetical protein